MRGSRRGGCRIRGLEQQAFGGEVLKGFAFALIIGILIGTYSSIFVAAPVVVEPRSKFAPARKR